MIFWVNKTYYQTPTIKVLFFNFKLLNLLVKLKRSFQMWIRKNQNNNNLNKKSYFEDELVVLLVDFTDPSSYSSSFLKTYLPIITLEAGELASIFLLLLLLSSYFLVIPTWFYHLSIIFF